MAPDLQLQFVAGVLNLEGLPGLIQRVSMQGPSFDLWLDSLEEAADVTEVTEVTEAIRQVRPSAMVIH